MPALLTRTSMRPWLSIAVDTIRATSSSRYIGGHGGGLHALLRTGVCDGLEQIGAPSREDKIGASISECHGHDLP